MVEGGVQRVAGGNLIVQPSVVVSRQHLRRCHCIGPTVLSAVADDGLSHFSLLRSNEDNTVGGAGSIDGCRGILQDGDALNFGRVEVVEGFCAEVLLDVADLHIVRIDISVDDEQRLLNGRPDVAKGVGSTDGYTRCLSRLRLSARHAEAVDETGERRGKVAGGDILYLVDRNALDRSREVSPLLGAVTDDDNLVEVGVALFQHYTAAFSGDLLVANVCHGQRRSLRRAYRIVTVEVGNGGLSCPRHVNGGSDDGIAILVDDGSLYRCRVLCHCRNGTCQCQSER